ncbi:hypothetical protein [Streptosporangium lutulentum]|uniref:Uncharacterized protein n=1 Tax=Streptosporangium lutulentum TaxID=1461250 RepID=A0ABT9QMQ8_9ACTN|nr:hypothetical protein [Streptosporangium lutulentum]MDP9848002.1 hypothetical protein [Streptosporangium lutulentum]
MPFLAATATHPAATALAAYAPLIVWLILAALGWLTLYVLRCAATPFGPCRHCHGEGKRTPRLSRKRRHCHRCEGTGLRLRTGRRVWNNIRRLYRDLKR